MAHSSDFADTVGQHASDLGQQAQAAVTQETVAQADQAKAAAAEKFSTAADATEAAAEQLDPTSPQAEAMQQVADQIEGVAAKIRDADVRQIAHDATEYARRNPLLFIGGAALAGFAAARFLKASDPSRPARSTRTTTDPWAEVPTDDGTAMAQINGERNHA